MNMAASAAAVNLKITRLYHEDVHLLIAQLVLFSEPRWEGYSKIGVISAVTIVTYILKVRNWNFGQ
jgi:hypothetical protein